MQGQVLGADNGGVAECPGPVSPIIATLDQVLEMWKLHPRDVTQTPDGQLGMVMVMMMANLR